MLLQVARAAGFLILKSPFLLANCDLITEVFQNTQTAHIHFEVCVNKDEGTKASQSAKCLLR